MIRRLVLVKQASDLNNSTINQMVMHRLAETAYDGQVERARAHYRLRRDAMLAALETHMPEGVTWTRPGGGLFVWLRLPDGMDGASLLDRAVKEAGVAFVPGAAFFHDDRGRNTLRLSYSLATEALAQAPATKPASAPVSTGSVWQIVPQPQSSLVYARDGSFIGEIHVAGHSRVTRGGVELLIDDHASIACEEVWRLYETALDRFGLLPSLVEWDKQLPGFETILGEARKAERIATLRTNSHARAA
jgi:hypothetical protein